MPAPTFCIRRWPASRRSPARRSVPYRARQSWTRARSRRPFAARRLTCRAPSLVCVENTHNGAGGCVTSLDGHARHRAPSRERTRCRCISTARVCGTRRRPPATHSPPLASVADTVMVSFSKGLGSPVGAALAGPRDLIADAMVGAQAVWRRHAPVGHPRRSGAPRARHAPSADCRGPRARRTSTRRSSMALPVRAWFLPTRTSS